MQQWEYMELYLFRDVYDSSNWVDNHPYKELKTTERLNAFGKEGWEVVSVVAWTIGHRGFWYLLKRPLP